MRKIDHDMPFPLSTVLEVTGEELGAIEMAILEKKWRLGGIAENGLLTERESGELKTLSKLTERLFTLRYNFSVRKWRERNETKSSNS